jgi:Aspartyl protease
MKLPLSTPSFQLLVALTSALVILPAIKAESHCPGSTASVTPRFVRHALIVIPVKINNAGPFDFMVDTGSQVTVIDPSLASQLDLKPQGRVGLVSVSNFAQASVTVLDTLEAGSKVVEKSPAIVQDLQPIQAADPRIRGVLGESFLAHFDLLVDYQHKLLCLDSTSAMRDNVRGERIPFVRPQHLEAELPSEDVPSNGSPFDDLPFLERLVISVHLSGTGKQPLLLQLDSGSDGPILYAGSRNPEVQVLVRSAAQQAGNTTNSQPALAPAFAFVPPQTMQIGNHILTNISFATPVAVAKNIPRQREDGLLPTLLFQRILISGAGHYVIFEPK